MPESAYLHSPVDDKWTSRQTRFLSASSLKLVEKAVKYPRPFHAQQHDNFTDPRRPFTNSFSQLVEELHLSTSTFDEVSCQQNSTLSDLAVESKNEPDDLIAEKTLNDITFKRCIFRRIELHAVTLNNVSFEYCTFVECKFEHCDFNNVSFQNSDFAGCSFGSCRISQSRFSGHTIDESSIVNPEFRELTMCSTHFRNTILNCVDLSSHILNDVLIAQTCSLNKVVFANYQKWFFVRFQDGTKNLPGVEFTKIDKRSWPAIRWLSARTIDLNKFKLNPPELLRLMGAVIASSSACYILARTAVSSKYLGFIPDHFADPAATASALSIGMVILASYLSNVHSRRLLLRRSKILGITRSDYEW